MVFFTKKIHVGCVAHYVGIYFFPFKEKKGLTLVPMKCCDDDGAINKKVPETIVARFTAELSVLLHSFQVAVGFLIGYMYIIIFLRLLH